MTRARFCSATNADGAMRFRPTSATTPMTASPWPSQRVRFARTRPAVTTSAAPSDTIVTSTYRRSSVQP